MENNYLNYKLFEKRYPAVKKTVAEFCKKHSNKMVIISFDKKMFNDCLHDIREDCKTNIIDKGTYQVYNTKDAYCVKANELTTRKFWRVLQNFCVAITDVDAYVRHVDGTVDDPAVNYEWVDGFTYKWEWQK